MCGRLAAEPRDPLSCRTVRFGLFGYSDIAATTAAWTVTAYGENLANSNASTFISTDQFIVAQTPLRPRLLGVSFGYKF